MIRLRRVWLEIFGGVTSGVLGAGFYDSCSAKKCWHGPKTVVVPACSKAKRCWLCYVDGQTAIFESNLSGCADAKTTKEIKKESRLIACKFTNKKCEFSSEHCCQLQSKMYVSLWEHQQQSDDKNGRIACSAAHY